MQVNKTQSNPDQILQPKVVRAGARGWWVGVGIWWLAPPLILTCDQRSYDEGAICNGS